VEPTALCRSNSIRSRMWTTGLCPGSLVGGVMAHQDEAGLLSVKFWSRWRVGSCGAPFGERHCGPSPRRRLRKGKTNRWNHARRGWSASLPRGIRGSVCRRQLRNCHDECCECTSAVVLPGRPRSGCAVCQNHACRGAGRCAESSLGRAQGGF